MQLYTIGYEGAALPDLIGVLKAAGVRTVLDVRDLPLSRRAGFSKRPLAATLAEAGIGYLHLKGLGTPKEGRLANRAGRMEEFWRIVDDSLATPEAAHDLARAAAVAAEAPACLLCFEAQPHDCHRLRVAELLSAGHGFEVRHLDPAAGADPAF